MKKWLLFAASGFLAFNVQAEASWCGYKDFFRLSDETHPGIYIVSGYSDSDIILQMIGPRSFLIRDNVQCTYGYAHVTVAYDVNNWCVLDIKDGPWMMHPTVNASCNGIKYLGTHYDGMGSFSYTIDLD